MRRRNFIIQGATEALSAGLAGCSVLRSSEFEITEPEWNPLEMEKKVPNPYGIMPTAEIGSTGIKVSKLGFGSNMNREFLKYERER